MKENFIEWKQKDAKEIITDIERFCKEIQEGMLAVNPFAIDCRNLISRKYFLEDDKS